jgi:hypothetical protein
MGNGTSDANDSPVMPVNPSGKKKVKAHCPICCQVLHLQCSNKTDKEKGVKNHIYHNHLRLWDQALSVAEIARRARGRTALAGDSLCPFCPKRCTPVGLYTHIRTKHRQYWSPSLTVAQMRRLARLRQR